MTSLFDTNEWRQYPIATAQRIYTLEIIKADDRDFFARFPTKICRWRPSVLGEFTPFQPKSWREVQVIPFTTGQRLVVPADIPGRSSLHAWLQDDDGPEYDLLGPVYRQRPWERHDHPLLRHTGKTLADLAREYGDEIPPQWRGHWVADNGKGARRGPSFATGNGAR